MTPPLRLESNSSRRVFFTMPSRVASTRYGAACVVAHVEHLRDLLVGLEREQVGHVLTTRVTTGLGQLVRLGPVDPALVGEEQQPVVRRRDEEVLDDVVLRSAAPRTPLPPRRCDRYRSDLVRLA